MRISAEEAAAILGIGTAELIRIAAEGEARGAVLKASGWEFDPRWLPGLKAHLGLVREKLARRASEGAA